VKGGARDRAARIIKQWLAEEGFPDRLVERERRDRAFLMEVVYGTIKWKAQLERLLGHLADRPPTDPLVRAYLLTGLYQIIHLESSAPHAVVNAAVEGAKTAGGAAVASFVNAVLRRALREKEVLLAALEQAPPSVRFSHPESLIARWTARWGWERTRAILEWDNGRPDVVIRIHLSRTSREALERRWAEAGITFRPHPVAPDRCLIVERGRAVTELPGWAEGWMTVQDPATLVPVELLDPKPGERLLDACCAPGGKMAAIADRLSGQGHLVGVDADGLRMRQTAENVARLRLENVRLVVGDVADPMTFQKSAEEAPFDGVLLDVPCTNTGVLRRRPDARWRFTPDRPARMAEAQRRLFEAAAARVRMGGRLVYATCSLEAEENEENVRQWLARHPEWQLVREILWKAGEHETDGVYAALLRR